VSEQPVEVYGSDDYAGMRSPRFAFYFGYEKTRCPHHGDDARCYCDESEWCFTASHMSTEAARYTQSELDTSTDGRLYADEPYSYLLAGIGRYLK
jgi:hypothetical protein